MTEMTKEVLLSRPRISEGPQSIVFRAENAQNGPVAIKIPARHEYASADEVDRLANEYRMTRDLPVIGVRRAFDYTVIDGIPALILPYIEALTLREAFIQERRPLKEALVIAIEIASVLHVLHSRGLVHRKLSSDNVLISSGASRVTLIDFSLAGHTGSGSRALNGDVTEASCLYIAPEQSGRVNWPVDGRADLYSLGVVLYEMFTGRPPFLAESVSELIHLHVAKKPSPACELAESIPEILSRIISKLLEKNPDDRYQSAYGLKVDLETCLWQLCTKARITGFDLGKEDFSGVFRLPRKLYGRERELEKMTQVLQSVASGAGEVLFISGAAGAGFTTLIDEFQKGVAERGGYFIAERHDAYQRNIPYHALVGGLTKLVQLLLMESSQRLAEWKAEIAEALGSNACFLAEMIPQIELILGKQSPVPNVPGAERQARVQHAMRNFVRAVARKQGLLVLCQDNMQWADDATLDLLGFLLGGEKNGHLLFLGAYRDTGVEPGHPLRRMIEALEARAKLETIQLGNLSCEVLNGFISDTLRSPPSLTSPLSELIYEKTQGNPLFSVQFLQSLYEEGCLFFDFDRKQWIWDAERIGRMSVTHNVIALMTKKIERLPRNTRDAISLAACLGHGFKVADLAVISRQSKREVFESLRKAADEGLILRSAEASQAGEQIGSQEDDPQFEFVHDRVRQAAYSLLPRKQWRMAHLAIGRMLLERLQDPELEEIIFSVADHLNQGFPYISDEQEKLRLAELNLIAGRKAKREAAYSAAIRYLSMGIGMLPPNRWKDRYDLTLKLYTDALEAEYLSEHFDRANLLSSEVLQHAGDVCARIQVYELRVLYYSAQKQNLKAIDAGRKALALLDMRLPEEPDDIALRLGEIQRELSASKFDFAELVNASEMRDPHELTVIRHLGNLAAPALEENFPLFALVISQMVLMSIKDGKSPLSPFAYGWYAVLLCGTDGDVEKGFQFGRVSLALLDSRTVEIESKVVYLFNVFVRCWKDHMRDALAPLQSACKIGTESGDLESASFSAVHYCGYLLFAGESLDQVSQKVTEYLEVAERFRLQPQSNLLRIWGQTALNLTQDTDAPSALKGDLFNEDTVLPGWIEQRQLSLVFSALCCRTMLQYFFGDYAGAVKSARKALEFEQGGMGALYIAEWQFYYGLALAAQYPASDVGDRPQCLAEIGAIQDRMRGWAEHAPANFLHKYDLLEAEKARVTGDVPRALQYYGRAIGGAREQGYVQEEALAYEREAELHSMLEREDLAGVCIQKSVAGYRAWGAGRKVEELEKRYRRLLPSGKAVSLDTAAIVRASHMLSQEVRLEQLLDRLMHIVIESAGAEKGILIENKDGQLMLQAKGVVGQQQVETMQRLPIERSGEVPLSVVNLVARTKEPVVLGDALANRAYAADPYIKERRTKSLLCVPIVHQAKLSGVLYLENNLATEVFTPNRLVLLKTLASQAAISMENAALYADLEAKIQELKHAEQALREGEVKYRRIVDTASEGILVVGPDGRTITFANARVAEMLGYEPEEMIGQPGPAFMPEEDGADQDRRIESRRKGISESYERRFRTKDGRIVWTLASATPMFDEEHRFLGSFAMYTDITARKYADESLRRLNRELRAISDCNQVLMRAEDESGLLNEICRIVCEKAGYRMAWVGFAQQNEAKSISPVAWAGVEEGYLANPSFTWAETEFGRGPVGIAIRTGESSFVQDFITDPRTAPWRQSALERGYRSCIALPLKDESLVPFGALTIYSTEPEAFTPEEIRLLEELAGDLAFGIMVLRSRIERKNAEESLRLAKATAEAANHAKDQFLAVLSHELRTPLTPVLATVSARQREEGLSSEWKTDLDLIRRNVEMEAKLIDDLLDVTKISRGRLELHPEIVDAHAVLNTALEICQNEISAKQMSLLLSFNAEPHYVRADPTRLRQVFWNLLKNAAEYSQEHGQIRLRTSCADGRVRIEVQDDGIGIRPELMPKIFDAFERGDTGAFPRRFGGLGLGLSIAKTVVELHQGTITAFSEGPGKGATFTVELPGVVLGAAQVPPPIPTIIPAESQSRKILLVDDHLDTLRTMSRLLRKWGYLVETADSVHGALERAGKEHFDLLVSDLGLPDGSGLDIIREVKPLYGLRGIALSGFGAEEDVNRSREAGFDKHLIKPVSFQDLQNAIREIISELPTETGACP